LEAGLRAGEARLPIPATCQRPDLADSTRSKKGRLKFRAAPAEEQRFTRGTWRGAVGNANRRHFLMRRSHLVLVLAALALAAAPAGAETIDFEDLLATDDPAQTLSEEYAHLGVHFSTSDDGATWSGLSGGDPGQWQLDGSNGAAFLGFDGSSYSALVYFDEPVQDLQLDVARGKGSVWSSDFFMLAGFRNSAMVEVARVFLGDVNSWTTLTMSVEVDKIFMYGVGFPGYRFGVDNLRWAGEESIELLGVEIDIRPDSETNPINPKSRGVVPVVLYGADDFDVTEVDVDTLAFGPGEAGVAHRNGPHLDDVDADGHLDLIIHHRMASTGIGSEDVEACLWGETLDGLEFEGCDAVTPVP